MQAKSMGALEWGLLLLLSLVWGGSFFFAEVALEELGPFTVVLGRVGFAAPALLAVVYLTGNRMPGDLATWGAFFVMGFLNNLLPFSLITWGQVSIDSGLASILNATTPLFVVLLAHVLTDDERLTPNRLAGVVVGFLGVVLLIGPQALRGLGAEGWGQLAVLGAALAYAFAGIYGRRLRRLPVTVAAAGMVTASSLLTLPVALFLEAPFAVMPGLAAWGAVLGVALASTALAYLLYFRILQSAGATNLLLVTFLIPVSAILLGVLVLGERLAWTAIAGMALIFLGLAAIDGRPLGLLRRVAKATSG